MTIKDILQNGFRILKENDNSIIDISTPYLDAVVLLAEALNVSKEKLYLYFNEHITEFGKDQYFEYIKKRKEGIPVSYIRRKKEFYGLNFYVDNRVLVPRPETEFLVYESLEIIKHRVIEEGRLNLNIIDVCTGSGCVAISLVNEINMYKKENRSLFENIIISACDVSEDALNVFKMNSKILLGRELSCFKSDLLTEANGKYDLIISNPPYLTSENVSKMLDSSWPEPGIALDGGIEGLDYIFKLIDQAMIKLKEDGCLIIEADDWQMPKIENKMKEAGFKNVKIVQDLSGWNRIITGFVLEKVPNF
jgi:release factor glutamine methyltransferase